MKFIFLFVQIISFLFFLIIAPIYIQGGDSAELVSASHHLFVPHPPGYPSYVWINYLWTHLFNVGTVFWRASVLSIIFSAVSIFLIFFPARKSLPTILLMIALIFRPVFIESAILPDVFSLHAFFISLMGIVFLYLDSIKKYFLIPIIFFLGLSNHHTAIFLFPCVFFSFFTSLSSGYLKKSIWGMVFGFIFLVIIYSSLLLMDGNHLLSWGKVNTFKEVMAHFLRKDYGTFSLASMGSIGPQAFYYFINDLLPFFGILIFALVTATRRKIWDLKLLTWLFILGLTFLFPLLMNVTPTFIGKEVLIRFHLMPLLVLVILILYILNKVFISKKENIIFSILLLPVFFQNSLSVSTYLNMRNDSLIEDHSRNLYSVAKKYTPSMVVAENDSSFFGIRYIQSFDPVQNISVVSLPLFFHDWFQKKISKVHPDFLLLHKSSILEKKELFFEDQIIKPNLSKINFVLTKDFRDGDWYKVIFTKLGRVVQNGKGVSFDDTSFIFQKFDLPVGAQSFTKGYLYYQYCHYYLAKGKAQLVLGNKGSAHDLFLSSLDIVPFCYPSLLALCEIDKSFHLCKENKMKEMDEMSKYFYFD